MWSIKRCDALSTPRPLVHLVEIGLRDNAEEDCLEAWVSVNDPIVHSSVVKVKRQMGGGVSAADATCAPP